jgi:Outer membrane protein and related peptidoglycan-associated (lipo)proteins
MPSIPLWLNR